MIKTILRSVIFIITFCLIGCGKVFSQDNHSINYTIVSDSSEDSLFCTKYCSFFDFQTGGIITGSTIPDQLIALPHRSIDQLLKAIQMIMDSAFEHSNQGTIITFSIMVDTSGVVRGAIVNTANPISKVSMLAARVVYDYLKTKVFIPASLHGRPVPSEIPIVYRIKRDHHDETFSFPELWPSYNNDEDYGKLFNFLTENLSYDDTLSITKTVYVRCVVDTLGYTHNHEVIQGTTPSLNKEAIRVCQLIKFDNPAMQNGRPVTVVLCIPVKFEPN